MNESERFNGFVRQELDDALFADLWDLYVFNESDLHSAAYFYVRRYFEKKRREHIFVRCEPRLNGMKPDIVVYERGRPVYVLEFKVFLKADYLNEELVEKDIEKLHTLIQTFETIRWGFFLLLYDCEEPYTFRDARLRRLGIPKVSVTTINARRTEEKQRRRVGYDEWRTEFDRLLALHERYA